MTFPTFPPSKANANTSARSSCGRLRLGLAVALLAGTVAGCTSLGAAGPSTGAIEQIGQQDYAGSDIALIELNGQTLQQIGMFDATRTFAAALGDGPAVGPVIGAGDSLEITLWEAPPAVLFGSMGMGSVGAGASNGAQNRIVLQQVVSTDGALNIPFVGSVSVAGREPEDVELEIVRRLAGRANDPQAVVRMAVNDARNVTVIGEVASSRRVPLGPRGERVLDILASAGGPRQPVAQTTVQLTRGTVQANMALDAIIADPAQNIRLQPDDIVSVVHQPYTFVALGAVARNAEIPFEGRGISLAQAMGRMGGLRDDRAALRGVFIFRLEDPAAIDPVRASTARRTDQGRIPVVYRLDLSDPSGFFTAQDFMIRDQDVIYVSTAPGVELQRFLGTVSSLAFSTIAITDALTR